MLPEETDHFEDVQTSSWRPIYHAGRLLVHNGCGFTAARLLGKKKKKEKKRKRKRKKMKKKIPFFLLPESVAERTRLENSPSEHIMIVKSGGAGREAGRGERVAHKRIIKRPA